ncbi:MULTISPECIES: NUDIX domain-containing protein [Halolamina]|uniref:NUDIX domain-containing protein n=1 Tax=Halolamina pelagica TaxID=699431 RepID=A0A1I5R6S1_9EURY|nr:MULTISPECIES: NUDIX domain-containing protein [Halolamina]NHX35708.1 NUDIX domain-containing protein [Halolamina sp. R1-12]SFP54090.1 NUDIX domain-containing protein [Halolamina pelagica]
MDPARAVDDTLDRLEARYGTVAVTETEWHVDPATYDAAAERAAAGTVGGAGTWVRREHNGTTEALLVREADQGGWSEPAGKQEPGESLAAAACRETYEEAGIECRLTGLLRAERAVHVAAGTGRPPLPRLIVVFEAEYLRGDPRPRDGSVDEAAWLSAFPDRLRYPDVAALPL